jgi:hypothetical protein
MAYILDDMVAAQTELDQAQRRADDYDGNNPNKHRASLDLARLELQLIISDLQQRNIIPKPEPTEKQRLSQALDNKFPNARKTRTSFLGRACATGVELPSEKGSSPVTELRASACR